MRVDEAPVGERILELAAQLAHIHVDRAVAGAQVAAPYGSVELLAGYDRAEASRHRDEQFELTYRQCERLPVGEHKAFLEPDLELARVQDVHRHVCALRKGGHDAKRRR